MPLSWKRLLTSLHDRGRVRGEIEPRAAFAHRLEQSAFAQADFLHFLGARQRREHDVRGAPEIGDRVDPRRARFEQRLRAFLADVVDDEVVARLAQVGRHPDAHGAETDEADFHACFLSTHCRIDAIDLLRGAAEQRGLFVRRIVLDDVLQRVPQRNEAARPSVVGVVALHHAAVGAEGFDRRLDIGLPGRSGLLIADHVGALVESEAPVGRSEAADLAEDVGVAREVLHVLAPALECFGAAFRPGRQPTPNRGGRARWSCPESPWRLARAREAGCARQWRRTRGLAVRARESPSETRDSSGDRAAACA